MKKNLFLLFPILFLLACTSFESNRAVEETAWELSEQLEDMNNLTLAVVDFDAQNIPEVLVLAYRDGLSTSLAKVFRESEMSHQVVTRDRVDAVFAEKALELQGLTITDAGITVGEVLGADVLVSGNLIWLEDDLYRGSVQLIDVSRGQVLGGASYDFWFDTESDE